MKGEQYRELSRYFSETKTRSNIVKALHDILPILMMVFYPVQMIYLGVTEGFLSVQFLKFTIVPLATFVIITVVRAIINARRPYEKYNYTPVVDRGKKGKSFPSRHTVSAFIIAMAFLYLNTALGVVMLVIAAAIAVVRVIAGVHFIRDVISGALISIVVGVLSFFVF